MNNRLKLRKDIIQMVAPSNECGCDEARAIHSGRFYMGKEVCIRCGNPIPWGTIADKGRSYRQGGR